MKICSGVFVIKKNLFLLFLLFVVVLLVGCEEPNQSYMGYGFIKDFNGSPVSDLEIVLSNDGGIVRSDTVGQWSAKLDEDTIVKPVPPPHTFIYPGSGIVNHGNERLDFVLIDTSKKDDPISGYNSFMLANALGYPNGIYGFYSEKINSGLLEEYMSFADKIKNSITQSKIDEIKQAYRNTKLSEVSVGENYTIVRPKINLSYLGLDTHMIMTKENNEWVVLIPGMFFLGQHDLDATINDASLWLSEWDDAGEGLEAWVSSMLFAEVFDRIFENTVGKKANEGLFVGKTRFRFIDCTYEDGVLNLTVNEDLVNVEKAYRGKLTLVAPIQFKRNVARFIQQVFELGEGIKAVNVNVHVPTYIDDYGTIEDKEVGKISIERSKYERINWETIRTEMVMELLDSDWWY